MFEQIVNDVLERTDGGFGAVIMGLDGIAVHTERKHTHPDIETVGMEFSFIIGQVKRAAESVTAGQINSMTVGAENVRIVIHTLDEEYFIAVALAANGNVGKCKYLLRIAAAKIREML